MAPIRQPTFAGGEFAPELWARTDLEKYASGARRLRNFVVTPRGAAATRAGTRYGGSTKADAWAWMIPFTYSNADTLLVVFTAGWIRFVTRANGLPGYVLAAGVPYEIASPYAAADLPKLRYAQVGNVIRLTCPGYDPRDLTRTVAAPLTFTLTTLAFDIPAANGLVYVDVSALDLVEDASHPKKQWAWDVTEVWQDEAGFTWETAPNPVSYVAVSDGDAWNAKFTYPLSGKVSSGGNGYRSIQANNLNHAVGDAAWWVIDAALATPRPVHTNPVPAELVLFPDRVVKLWSPAAFGLTVAGGARRLERLLYRRRGKIAGYVGEYEGTTFSDTGDDPAWSVSPPKGENPFKILDNSGALVRTEQPAAVAYHEQRCVFANTAQRQGFAFLSVVNDYNNFDSHDSTVLAGDAFSRELAATTWEEIRALVSGRVLMAFTNSAEWALSGGGPEGAAISPLQFAARPRTEIGSSWVAPVKVSDDRFLFFGVTGNTVHELGFDGNAGTYDAPDVTVFSDHLFAGRQIVARAWQRKPWSILWVVLDDGKLLSFSYAPDHQLRAWCWHDTEGAVESICCVREGAEDALYLSVRRTINGATKRFIERMDTRLVTDARRGLFLDAAVSYDGAPATHFTGLDHLEGCTVNALADGNVVTGLVVAGGAIDLPAEQFPDGASIVHVGLPYVAELELLDVALGKGKERVKTVSSVILEYAGSRGGFVGQAFDKKLEEWRQRTVAIGHGAIPLESGEVKIPITSSWNSGGRAVVRQVDPLPLTITAVTREVEYGG